MTGLDFVRIDVRLTYPITKESKLYVELTKIPNPNEDSSKKMCIEKVLVAIYKPGEKCLTKSKVIYKLSTKNGYNAKFRWDDDFLNNAVPEKCTKTYFCVNALLKFPEDPAILSPLGGDSVRVGEMINIAWEKTTHSKDDDFEIYLCRQVDGTNGIKMSLLGNVKGGSNSFSTVITKSIMESFKKTNLYGTYTDHMYFISIIIRCKDYKKCKNATTFVRGVNTFSIMDMSEPMINWPPEP